MRESVRRFFKAFDEARESLDTERLRPLFADPFLSLAPGGATIVPREDFLAALPMRARLFAAHGVDRLDPESLAEHPLDAHHTLVKASWSVRFRASERVSEGPALESSFLLRLEDGAWQIVAYVNHQEIAAVLAGHA